MEDQIQIFVKGADGIQKVIQTELSITLADLKHLIEEAFGKPIERLAFGGKTLNDAQDDKSLSELKIKNMATLQATLRLRGGQ